MQTFSKGGNITCSISDYFLQFCQIDIFYNTNLKNTKNSSYSRNWSIFNKREFEDELTNIDWNEIKDPNTDTNQRFSKFFTKIERLLDETAPVKKLSKKENGLKERPWITNGILTSMNKRDSLYKEFTNEKEPLKRTKSMPATKKHRNLILTLTRTSKNFFKKTNLT